MSPVLQALRGIAEHIKYGGSMPTGEVLARVELAIEAIEWRPISTAPYEQWIEVRWPNHFAAESGCEYTIACGKREQSMDPNGCWRNSGGSVLRRPTHWRPMS